MSGTAVIRIDCPHRPWFGRYRSHQVLVDGMKLGSVRNGDSGEFEVTAGEHLVQVRMDWAKSPEVAVLVQPGDTVGLTATITITKPSLGAMWKVVFHPSQVVDITAQ